MKTSTILVLLIFYFANTYSQDGERLNDIKGYRLKTGKVVFIYYQDANGAPDLTISRTLNSSVFFTPYEPNLEITVGGKTYSLILIPGNQTAAFGPPKNGQIVSSSDYNEPLWIEKSNIADKSPEYFKYRNDVVLGILTVPFKFRPTNGNSVSSVIDGSFNVGPYVGYKFRLSQNRPFFANLVLTGGPTSMTYNSANNSGITDKEKSETGFGFQYGGGLIFDLYKVQLGVIFAGDNGVGEISKTFKYQNNLWMAFSLSFNFLGATPQKDDNKN